MFELKRFEFILQANNQMAHHSESIGNTAVVMRRKVRQPEGGWAQVPCVTGDTMRHGMREAGVYAYLDAAGLLGPELGQAALRLLFNGGVVSGKDGSGAVRLDAFREMVDLVPIVSMLGGCASNRVVPGRLIVEDAILICRESQHLLPDWVREQYPVDVEESMRGHMELATRVRGDATLDPTKRALLTDSARAEVERRLLASETAAVNDDAAAKDDAKSSMLPRAFECVASGAHYFWAVEARCVSDLDVDTFHVMTMAFLANARVGGKRGSGHGLLRAVAGRGVQIMRPAERLLPVDTTDLALKAGEIFRQHVSSRKEQIRTFLQTVDA